MTRLTKQAEATGRKMKTGKNNPLMTVGAWQAVSSSIIRFSINGKVQNVLSF